MSAATGSRAWRVGIDIGGTFTDIVAVHDRTGERRIAKTPTVPSAPFEGLVAALEAVGLSWADVATLIHGTTMVTNALVEGKTAPVALVTTRGFEDVLAIARQSRRFLYDLAAPPRLAPEVPPERCFGVEERIDVTGATVTPLVKEAVTRIAAQVMASGAEAVAVALLHSYADPAHELAIGEALRRVTPHVSLSHEVSPEAREYERTVTTVLNASVTPRTVDYVDRLAASVPEGTDVFLFHSAGGMTSLEDVRRRPLTLAMSGPAAGAAAAASAARETGIDRALAFDMGGTTTDVSLIVDGAVEIASNKQLAGRPIRQPMVAIESIGAGGGSLVRLGIGGLTVGPQSAGADPGPAVYGRGGTEPTIADANALLGYLDPDRVLGGAIRLDLAAAEAAYAPVAEALGRDIRETALGVLRVANALMARALRRITVERGVDIRSCALVAFGGAGPMHACGLAREVGVRRILVPALSGGFSAYGCVDADLSFTRQRTVRLKSSDWDERRFISLRESIAAEALEPLANGAVGTPVVEETALMSYVGQSDSIEVRIEGRPSRETISAAFRAAHERLYGYATDEAWKIEALRVRATAPSDRPAAPPDPETGEAAPEQPPLRVMTCWFESGAHETPRLDRDGLAPEAVVTGPAIIEDASSTVVIEPGARAWRDALGHLHIELPEASA